MPPDGSYSCWRHQIPACRFLPVLQTDFVRKWAVGIGIDSVVQCREALLAVLESAALYLITGRVMVGPEKWLGMWLDASSIQARRAFDIDTPAGVD